MRSLLFCVLSFPLMFACGPIITAANLPNKAVNKGPSNVETGRSIDLQNIEAIKRGETTKDDFLKMFGAPEIALPPSPDGTVTYLYRHCRNTIDITSDVTNMRSSSLCNQLTVVFDTNSTKVRDYDFVRAF